MHGSVFLSRTRHYSTLSPIVHEVVRRRLTIYTRGISVVPTGKYAKTYKFHKLLYLSKCVARIGFLSRGRKRVSRK